MGKQQEEINTEVETEVYKTFLEDALYYHKQKLTVIPIRGRYAVTLEEAKRPLIQWQKWQGKKPTKENIQAWFNQKPDADIGLLTGPTNGIIALDVDGKQGYKSIADKPIPRTWINVTRRGEHYIFRWDRRLDGVATTKVGVMPGIDTRGKGGYIIAPPSVGLGDFQYKWKEGAAPTDVELANPPEWLVQLLLQQEAKQYSEPRQIKHGWLDEVREGVSEGENRHKAMCRLASFYASRGIPIDDVRTLMKAWNLKCTPPKPEDVFEEKLDSFLHNWESGRYQSNNNVTSKLSPMSSKDFVSSGSVEIDWIVKGFIPAETITFLHGYGGVGKSFMALDLAIEMGRGGGAWLKQFPVVGGRVLYIDEESHPTLLRQRYNCLLRDKGLDSKSVDVNFISLSGLKLDKEASLDSLRSVLIELKPDYVIFDPFISIHDLNENSSKDMGLLRGVFKQLIKDFKCGLLFIDHENKPSEQARSAAQRQRGSSEKDAVADVKIAVRTSDDEKIVEHAKSRYGVKMPTFLFEIKETGIGKIEVRAL